MLCCPPLQGFVDILATGVLLPFNRTEQGFLFIYPLYLRTDLQSVFTLGTWYFTIRLILEFSKYVNQEFNSRVFRVLRDSSLINHVVHDFWIHIPILFLFSADTLDSRYEISQVSVSKPSNYWLALISAIASGEVGSLATYMMVKNIL